MAARVACPAGTPLIAPRLSTSGRPCAAPARAPVPPSPLPRRWAAPAPAPFAALPRRWVAPAAAGITELASMEDYESFIAGDGVAVVDYYTTWCGPCKMIAPAVEEMASDIPEARFAKFNMESVVGAAALSKEKGVKALPTFHIFRNGVLADQMSGSNGKALRKMVTAAVMAGVGAPTSA